MLISLKLLIKKLKTFKTKKVMKLFIKFQKILFFNLDELEGKLLNFKLNLHKLSYFKKSFFHYRWF